MAGFTPWVLGQTSPTWTILCQRDGKVFDLTGQIAGNISLLLYKNVATSVVNGQVSYTKVATLGGTVTILSANPAILTYAPISADTISLVPGQYWVRVEVNFNGTNPDYSDYLPFFVGA